MQVNLRVFLTLVVLLLCCAACCIDVPLFSTPVPTLTPSPTPEPKVLTVCMLEEPDSLYLYGTDSLAAQHIWQAIYDGPLDSRAYTHQPVILTDLPHLAGGAGSSGAAIQPIVAQAGDRVLDTNGQVVDLAPGVTVEDVDGRRVAFDGTTVMMRQMVVTFTLQAGIVWSDGEPLTADDSVFSFELNANSATPGAKTVVERTAGYRAVDEHTVVWRGVPGLVDHFYALNFWHPLPRHAWGHLSAAELLGATPSTRQPLGWGPFMLQEWVPGDRITVVRNPFYFRASSGLPRLDIVTFRFIPDPIVLAQELVAGRCDVVPHESVVPVRAALPSASLAEFQTLSAYDARWELLAFGISPNRDYDRPDFFEDVRVRQGIALCIDRQSIVDQAVELPARMLDSFVPPEHPLYAGSELTVWGADPPAGQALLASAGWYDGDGDGIREAQAIPGMADGVPFQVTVLVPDDPVRIQVAHAIGEDLAVCGIHVDIEPVSPDLFFAPGPEGPLFGRRFDLAQFSWRATADPLCDLFLSEQISDPGRWELPNVSGFLDDAYDMACLSALGALPGSDEYVTGHTEAQRIFTARLPVLPLFQRSKTVLARASVMGLAPNPTELSEFWNIEQIDLRP